MAYLDVSSLIYARQRSHAELEFSRGELHHMPSRHRFFFDSHHEVTMNALCIRDHARAALRYGALQQEIVEAIRVAAEMRAGGSYAHSALALEEMEKAAAGKST